MVIYEICRYFVVGEKMAVHCQSGRTVKFPIQIILNYRVTSLKRNRTHLGTYSRTMRMVLRRS